MAYIIWKESFKIGIKEMDEQHRQFAAHVNELYDAVHLGNAEAIIGPILNKITDSIKSHFADEEAILKSVNYPMVEAQIKQHAYCISELILMKSSFLNKTQTAHNTLLFVKDWFVHHVTTEDLKYAEYVYAYTADQLQFKS